MLASLEHVAIGDMRDGDSRVLVSTESWAIGPWPRPSDLRPRGDRAILLVPSPTSAANLAPSARTAVNLRPLPESAGEE